MNTTKPIPPPTEVPPSADPACGGLPKRTVGGTHLIDLTGRRFGRWTVRGRAENAPNGAPRWFVTCDCGRSRTVLGAKLRTGESTSCGCFAKEQVSKSRLVNLTGRRFHRLVVLGRASTNTQNGASRWVVKCDCGVVKEVDGTNLTRGSTKSCGCYNREASATRRGDRHPSWNPTLTPEERSRNRLGTPAQRRWGLIAKQVRRRDRATCLVCGAPQSTHVHHLEPWALNRDLRYSPANLVTLCKECHDQFHYLYGKDAGLDELEEFLC